MSTRSLIGKQDRNSVTYIYCHFDGYPKHNGEILNAHYTSPEKVDELIELGGLSVLGAKIGGQVDWNTFRQRDTPREEMQCVAYVRDRGCTNRMTWTIPIEEYGSIQNRYKHWAEYVYLYKDGEWQTIAPH